MKVQIVHLEDFDKASLYSAQILNDNLDIVGSEQYLEFLHGKKKVEKDRRQLGELQKIIKRMVTLDGAEENFFRRENSFRALPPHWFTFFDSDGIEDFGLRLYCIRVNDEALILLNGGRKTAQSVQNCPNCFPHFQFADKLTTAFYNAIYLNDIEVDGSQIKTDPNFYLEI